MGDWIRNLNDASLPFLVWLQGLRSAGLDGFMLMMSYLGSEYFYILLFPVLYWAVSKRLGLLAGTGLLVSVYIGEYIKWAFQLPRPGAPVLRLWEETSPGFVSTHAAPAVGVWGTLAVAIRRTWFTVLALFMIFFISLSRLYLGVHFPADVVGGWIVGLFAMWFALKAAPRLAGRARGWGWQRQVGAALLLALVLLLIFPPNWEGQRPADSGMRTVGIILGFLLGLIWDDHRLHFQPGGPWGRRAARCVLGLVLLLVFFFGLDLLFSPFTAGSFWLDQAVRLLRYTLVGFTVIGLGPWVFQRLRLA